MKIYGIVVSKTKNIFYLKLNDSYWCDMYAKINGDIIVPERGYSFDSRNFREINDSDLDELLRQYSNLELTPPY